LINNALPSPNYLGWTYWNNFGKFLITYSDQFEIVDKDHISEPPKDTAISFTAWISNWPVVNITKQQANLYCDFRTKDYQVFYNSQKKKKKVKYPANLIFRLPTANEWVYAASSGLDTMKYKYGVEGDNLKYSSPVSIETFSSDTTGQSHPFPVTSGQMNKSKILNMCGNIAELVCDNDFVYGGSFLDPTINCTVTSKILFTEPKNNIGFRIVAVIRSR
ncbi:MAG TPA: SUMF1/EgtB/PvdO family nonheme iron enzyme, partial [Flavisolibacter sp.]